MKFTSFLNTNLIGELEALLFVYAEPIEITEIAKYFDISEEDTNDVIDSYEELLEANNRGLTLIRIDDKIQLTSKKEYGKKIKEFIRPVVEKTLTNAAMETLIIVALKQPVLKTDIQKIRGVQSDNTVNRLVDLGFIEIHDRLDTVGRPYRYKTTDLFLKEFGLTKLDDLENILNDLSGSDIYEDQ